MRKMFFCGALFNWCASVLICFFVTDLFKLLHITPAPTEMMMVQWFAALAFGFGIGYFWIARDPVKNQQIILLGGITKLLLVTVGVIEVSIGMISWQILIILSVDFVYALLFFRAYKFYSAQPA